MDSYERSVEVLDQELRGVLGVFADLGDRDWSLPTNLEPVDRAKPHWSLLQLAGHFAASIGLTRTLVAEPRDGQVARDRASFFIFSRAEVAPVVYDHAYKMVEGKKPQDMPGVLAETFGMAIEEARASQPTLVGSGYYALMELGEFVASRVVEAVVHGLDLTDPLGRDPVATADGVAMCASILDQLLARRTVAGRPPDLAADLDWIRAASGRRRAGPYPDHRLPLIG